MLEIDYLPDGILYYNNVEPNNNTTQINTTQINTTQIDTELIDIKPFDIKQGNSIYKFIPRTNDINIKLFDQTQSNHIYSKNNAIIRVEGEMIFCNDISLIDIKSKKLINETYDDYLDFISKRNFEKEQWIYNIIDGYAEQDKILFSNDKFIIIPTFTWDEKTLNNLHLLSIIKDKQIKSIRDLTSDNIKLLEEIKKTTLDLIKRNYGLNPCDIKIYLHYSPSTYQLHIHFENTISNNSNSSVEYSHSLDAVIFNLSICSDYYKLITLSKYI